MTLTECIGSTRSYLARIHEEMSRISPEHTVAYDVVARSDWDSEVCDYPIGMMGSIGSCWCCELLTRDNSDRNHSMDDPGFFAGIALPSDQ